MKPYLEPRAGSRATNPRRNLPTNLNADELAARPLAAQVATNPTEHQAAQPSTLHHTQPSRLHDTQSQLASVGAPARRLQVIRAVPSPSVGCCALCWIGPAQLAGTVVVDGTAPVPACGRCLVAIEALFVHLGPALVYSTPTD